MHLKTLFLHNNVVVEVPTSLCQLTQLTEFSLDWLIYVEEKQVQQLAQPSQNFDPKQMESGEKKSGERPSERITVAVTPNHEINISTITANNNIETAKANGVISAPPVNE